MIKKFSTVAIVGVGLIGGSIGLALRQRGLADRVIGIGRRQESLRIARRVGAVTNTTIELARGVAEAELVVVCTPVGRIVEDVRRAAEYCPPGTLITDAGSTKQVIVDALDTGLPRGCRFLGSHPLAGSEKAGPSNADANLFEGRVALITPTKNTHADDFDVIERFWSQLGSVVIQMPPADHDLALAATSHLPHAVAAVLAGVLPEKWFRLVGTGFLDTTRLAGSEAALWRQIFSQNRRNLAAALREFDTQLHALVDALREGKDDDVERILAMGKKNRDALGN